MRVSSTDLINLPVYTKSGNHIGKVASFELDSDTGMIENFYVKTGLIEGLWHEQLMIHRSQVVEITVEKMVVDDTTIKEHLRNLNLAPAADWQELS